MITMSARRQMVYYMAINKVAGCNKMLHEKGEG